MRLLGRDCCLILDHFEKNNSEGRTIEIIDYSHSRLPVVSARLSENQFVVEHTHHQAAEVARVYNEKLSQIRSHPSNRVPQFDNPEPNLNGSRSDPVRLDSRHKHAGM